MSSPPKAAQISLKDIAYGLSRINRFNGATDGEPYSVAQHSVLVSRECKYPLHGLFHDAHEAYLGDQTNFWKSLVTSNLKEIEQGFIDAISEKFGLVWTKEIHDEVKRADIAVLLAEVRDLVPQKCGADLGGAAKCNVSPIYWKFAEEEFEKEYRHLTGEET